MANLQDSIVILGKLDELPGFLNTRSNRLLHQHVNPALHQFTAHVKVRNRGNRDAGQVAGFGQRFERIHRFCTEFFGNGLRSLQISIIHSRQLGILDKRVTSGMISPH